jgi:hypothetical protein
MNLKLIIILSLIITLKGSFDRCLLAFPDLYPIAEDLIIAVQTNDLKAYTEIFLSCTLSQQIEIGLCHFSTDLSSLQEEAKKITKSLFNINHSFTFVGFEEEVVLYDIFYRITEKFVHSCDITFKGEDSGFIEIKGGVIINKDGYDINLPKPLVETIEKLTNIKIEKTSYELQKKFKNAIVDGKIKYKFSRNKIEIAVILTNSFNKVTTCDGSIIFTITPGSIPEYSYEYQNALEQLKYSGVFTGAVICIYVIGELILKVVGPLAFLLAL